MTSNTEVAKLQDGQLVYGTYEEVEAYAEAENTCVAELIPPFSQRMICAAAVVVVLGVRDARGG